MRLPAFVSHHGISRSLYTNIYKSNEEREREGESQSTKAQPSSELILSAPTSNYDSRGGPLHHLALRLLFIIHTTRKQLHIPQ